MNKGTKASGGTKARKRPQSPEGKAIGALMKHKSKQYSLKEKHLMHEKQVQQSKNAKSVSVSGTLFDKTGNFHDRADND